MASSGSTPVREPRHPRRSRELPVTPAGWPLGAWITGCALAEGIGMTAAAAAARTADTLQAHGHGPAVALAVVVAGGLVEGVALGVLQAAALRSLLERPAALRWALVTLVVAGLGWAAASAPAVAGSSGGNADGTTRPSLLLIAAGAVALGAVLGAALGAAQSTSLRHRAAKPWRWVWISGVGWAAAMPVIFLGASLPSANTPTAVVVVAGTGTGLLAGALLGSVTGVLLPSLGGQPVVNTLLLQLLASPAHRVVDRSLLALRVTGTVTGRTFTLPVQYATDESSIVVLPGHHERKRWWRNLRGGADVAVLLDRRWAPGHGRVLSPGDAGYDAAASTYRRRWPHAVLSEDQPLVRVVRRR